MLDLAQIGPVVDYIQWRRGEQPDFSMKGRTPGALLRDVEGWHTQLHRTKVAGRVDYEPSGFPPYIKTVSVGRDKTGNHIEVTWRVMEILSGSELADEGRVLRHCVYSYTHSIQSGRTSIWSMTRAESHNIERRITVEVNNRTRQIVQARGLHNRRQDMDEFRVMKDWADKAGLTISSYL
jgi:hypothetical protein